MKAGITEVTMNNGSCKSGICNSESSLLFLLKDKKGEPIFYAHIGRRKSHK